MTRNQIDYLKLVETQRANRAQEALTQYRDQSNIQLGFEQLSEAKRHNVATENQQYAVLGETMRHNQALELLQRDTLTEQQRHSLAVELETTRHNQFLENETYRSNFAREQETHRSNLANEAQRSAELTETVRFHNQQYALGSAQVRLGYSQLAETTRANQAREYENYRSNTMREQLQLSAQQETQRANQVREAETYRSNTAREVEQHRSNTVNEQISVANTIIRGVDVAADLIGTVSKAGAMIIAGL